MSSLGKISSIADEFRSNCESIVATTSKHETGSNTTTLLLVLLPHFVISRNDPSSTEVTLASLTTLSLQLAALVWRLTGWHEAIYMTIKHLETLSWPRFKPLKVQKGRLFTVARVGEFHWHSSRNKDHSLIPPPFHSSIE